MKNNAAAVFLFGAGTLAYEVLLAHFFIIAQHHHLQFIVISIALLGTGASGTFLNLFRHMRFVNRGERFGDEMMPALAIACSLSAIGAYVVINLLPFDFFRIALEPVQFFYLVLAFLLFSIPFFMGGMAVGLVYTTFPEKAGTTYIASLIGSAVGALLPVFTLSVLGTGGSILVASFLPLPLALFPHTRKKWFFRVSALLVAGASILLFAASGARFRDVEPSSYKAYSDLVSRTGSRLSSSRDSLYGRIDVVESSSLRFAPGLSILFTGTLPVQRAVFLDAGSQTVLYGRGDESGFPFVKETLAWAATFFSETITNALVIERDGGSGVPLALTACEGSVTLLDENPVRSTLFREHYRNPRLSVVDESARAWLSAADTSYDLIVIDHAGSSLPGLESLSEEYLFTVEAFQGYYRLLSESGVLVVSRTMLLPPTNLMRLSATVFEALVREGAAHPEEHLVVISGLGISTAFVIRRPPGVEELARIKEFAQSRNFDLVYYPGMEEKEANTFFVFPEPYYFRAVQTTVNTFTGATGERNGLPFDVVPVPDDKPFFSRFIKWNRLGEYQAMTGGRTYALFVSGEIVVASALGIALLLSGILIVLSLVGGRGNGVRDRVSSFLFYFFLGMGFIWIELGFISGGLLLFANSAVSFVTVLVLLFISSGTGGYLSQKIPARVLPAVCLAVSVTVLALALSRDVVLETFLGLPGLPRMILFSLSLLPVGFLIGIPFPLRMRTHLASGRTRGFAWAVNGSASVLGAVSEVCIALIFGLQAVFFGAAIFYAGAAGVIAFTTMRKR